MNGFFERVLRKSAFAGGAYLDNVIPAWRREVDSDSLDVSNGCKCPLGQMFSTFDSGREYLRISPAMAARHGFVVGPFVSFFIGTRRAYEILTAEWKRIHASEPTVVKVGMMA
jgi:hypothetical protein